MAKRNGSVNPKKFLDEQFELYSVPAFDSRHPELVFGNEIGSSKQLIAPDDVLLSKIVPHIRRGWVVGERSELRQIGSGEWIVFRSDEFEPNYLKNLVVSDWFNARFMRTVSGVGGSLLRARPAEVAKIEIPFPPLAEQRRIAAILDKADALRQQRQQAIAKLDELLQSVFLDMFGDPVTNPRGWLVKPIAEVISQKPTNGAYYSKDRYTDKGGVEMAHMSDAFYGQVARGNMKRVLANKIDLEKYSLTSRDILISRRSLVYEGAAKPCLVPDSNEPLIFESSLIRLTPDENVVGIKYLYSYLSNERARSKYLLPYVTKSTISGINQTNLLKVGILCPPIKLQKSFSAFYEKLEEQKSMKTSAFLTLNNLFSSLQQRAFNGTL